MAPAVGHATLTARVISIDRIVSRSGKTALVASLDCTHLSLLHFTAALHSNQVKQRKRGKRGLPASRLRMRTCIVDEQGDRQSVEVQIGFVNPLDAGAIVSVAERADLRLEVGTVIEFAI